MEKNKIIKIGALALAIMLAVAVPLSITNKSVVNASNSDFANVVYNPFQNSTFKIYQNDPNSTQGVRYKYNYYNAYADPSTLLSDTKDKVNRLSFGERYFWLDTIDYLCFTPFTGLYNTYFNPVTNGSNQLYTGIIVDYADIFDNNGDIIERQPIIYDFFKTTIYQFLSNSSYAAVQLYTQPYGYKYSTIDGVYSERAYYAMDIEFSDVILEYLGDTGLTLSNFLSIENAINGSYLDQVVLELEYINGYDESTTTHNWNIEYQRFDSDFKPTYDKNLHNDMYSYDLLYMFYDDLNETVRNTGSIFDATDYSSMVVIDGVKRYMYFPSIKIKLSYYMPILDNYDLPPNVIQCNLNSGENDLIYYKSGYEDLLLRINNSTRNYIVGSPFSVIIQGISDFVNTDILPGFSIGTILLFALGIIVMGIALKVFLGG